MDSRLEQLKQALESAVEGMSSEQLRWHPEGKWCAGEVLEHLYLTYTGSIRGFEKVLDAGTPLARRRTVMDRVRTLVVVGFGHFPEGRRGRRIRFRRDWPRSKCGVRSEKKLLRWILRLRVVRSGWGVGRRCWIIPF
jgi:hypothetical protein